METDQSTNQSPAPDSPAVADCPAPVCSDSERRSHVTSDEAIDLLLSWANRISDLADELEEVKFLEVRKQDDLRSGIQERAQCMIDLLCLLSGRGVQ